MFSSKSKTSPDLSAVHIASSILRSRPAYDTIALLILLLALPSMLLTIVQMGFSSLTLMPGGLSPFSFLSVFDVFQGSGGPPSLGVMAWVDLVFFGLWLCLWNWAQHFALDLAQIHIAMTLGNGGSSKNSSLNYLCFAFVLMLHTGRSRAVRQFVFKNLIPADLLAQAGLTDLVKFLPKDNDLGDTPSAASKLQSLFAIHILSQALISFVRKKLATPQPGPNTKSQRKVDPESSANAHDTSAANGTAATVPDPSSISTTRDAKDKGASAKKRRRQAVSVRSKQPFWAALASTKVHVMREVEHGNGLTTVASAPSSPFDAPQRDAVWVTEVDPASIHFEAAFAAIPLFGDQESQLPEDVKPFYIRINGARWQAVAIQAKGSNSTPEDHQAQWTGEISGLAPDCTYTCTFLSADKDQEWASVMVKTPPVDDPEFTASAPPLPGRQSARPSSPTTTLKNSIASADVKLVDARRRLQQLKKMHRTSLSKVDKEINTLNGRLEGESDDNKLRQKLLQTKRNIQQSQDALKSFRPEALDSVPEHQSTEYGTRKGEYERQKALLAEANQSLTKAKSDADGELSCVNGELTTIASRKERMVSRQTRLAEQHDRITQANAQGLNEKERKEAESARKEADNIRRETELINHMTHMAQESREVQMRIQANWQELDALEKQDMMQRQKLMTASGPLTPEGELPGTRPVLPQSARAFAFGSVNVPVNNHRATGSGEQSSPFLAFANTLPSETRRPRSDTNRSLGATSNYSADFDDADPIPPMPAEYDLNGRKGSGSSRGKNNGSPAGVISGGLRSPQRGSNSPGHLPGASTW
jgi:ubiquitination network signaling protein AcrB